ncbi:MAG: diacylglycerol kinase family lipid kinase [Syntrophotaleaceae bacterium]
MTAAPLVVCNLSAGSGKHELLMQAVTRRGFQLAETDHAGHGTELACQAASEGRSLILAAGGDGTIHEVASGILKSGNSATLGILPLGTGNDLCRSLGIDNDIDAALQVIDAGREVDIDVGRLRTGGEEHLFFNVSACGFGGEVDKNLEEDEKKSWKTLSYLKSGLAALTKIEAFQVEVQNDEDKISALALNVVLGNGRYAAAGIPVAPRALLTDGKLDLVLYLGEGLGDQILNSRLILKGEQDRSDTVLTLRSETFDLKFSRPLAINYDGELHDRDVEDIRYSIHSRRLRVIVGRNFIG